MTQEVKKIAEWLDGQVLKNPYGRLSVSLELHAGRITRIDRTITEKVKTGGGQQ